MSSTIKTFAVALLALACVNGAMAAEKKLDLRAADYWDDQYPTVKGLKRMGRTAKPAYRRTDYVEDILQR